MGLRVLIPCCWPFGAVHLVDERCIRGGEETKGEPTLSWQNSRGKKTKTEQDTQREVRIEGMEKNRVSQSGTSATLEYH